jgi:hypothetical protein
VPVVADPSPGWTLRDDVPYARIGHAAIFDEKNDRMIVFGGAANDAWQLPFSGPNANRWSQLKVAGQLPPSHRSDGHNPDPAVYDKAGQRMLLFVHANAYASGAPDISALWQLSLEEPPGWSAIPTAGGGPSSVVGLALDEGGHRLFAVGDGVWSLSLEGTPTWTALAQIPGQYGGVDERALVAFDERGHRLIVSAVSGQPSGDGDGKGPWALSLDTNEWTQLSSGNLESGAVTVFDEAHDRFLRVAGEEGGRVYVMPLHTGTWNDTRNVEFPGADPYATAVIDAKRDRLLYFGGQTNAVSAMDLDTLQWETVVGASRRSYFTTDGADFVWDPVRARVVAFGNIYSSDSDTLVRGLRSSDDWRSLTPSPFAACGAAFVYDPVGEAIVSYGSCNAIGDLLPWRLSSSLGASWQQLDVANGPGARFGSVAIYDAANARMIIQGGRESVFDQGYIDLADVWALTLDASPKWQTLETEDPSPPARSGHVGIYDPEGRRLLIYGGSSGHDDSFTGYSDLWSLSLDGVPRWTQLDASGKGPGSLDTVDGSLSAIYATTSAVYDPAHRRMLVLAFSGVGAVHMFALELGDALTWHEFCSPGVTPASVVDWGATSNLVLTPDGLFFNSGGASFRFNLNTPYCDG